MRYTLRHIHKDGSYSDSYSDDDLSDITLLALCENDFLCDAGGHGDERYVVLDTETGEYVKIPKTDWELNDYEDCEEC